MDCPAGLTSVVREVPWETDESETPTPTVQPEESTQPSESVEVPDERMADGGQVANRAAVQAREERDVKFTLENLGSGLARIFKRCSTSVKRAVERGELPPPIRLFGAPTWTAGALLQHLEKRLEAAATEADQMQRKIRQLSP